MRIDLKVPYAEKDSAKAKGARWDIARKVWYIVDPPSLEPFARWIGEEVQEFYRPTKKRRPPKRGLKPLPRCNCTTPPWEDCPHTEAQANDILRDDYGIQPPLGLV